MKRLRRVTEAEVISEFLKNEFYHEEFHRDRQQWEHLVLDADITNERENLLRRALLFRRRGHMWRELPAETQWWQVQIEPGDLERVRVFPRAHWLRIGRGNFYLKDVAERVRVARRKGKKRDFISKIQSLSHRLRVEYDNSSVMLIGVDDTHPLTILEGNHRLTAALLASPSILQSRFRVLVGFSLLMTESCWYETNVRNLWRYAKNRMRHLYDREADTERLLSELETGSGARAGYTEPMVARKVAAEPK